MRIDKLNIAENKSVKSSEQVKKKEEKLEINMEDKVTLHSEETHHKEHHEEPLWAEGADFSHLEGVTLNIMAKAGSHAAKEGAHVMAEAGEGVHEAGHAVSPLLGLSTVVAGIGAVGLLANSAREFKEGNKIGGTSSLLAGLASGSEVVAGTIHTTGILGSTGLAIAGVAGTTAGVLGSIHGTIEIGRGTKEIYDGIKLHNNDKIVNGSLRIGIGGALIGAIATGNVIPAAAAVVMLGAKVAYNHREFLEETGEKIADKIKG